MIINCICTIRIVLYIETYGDLIHIISLITGIRMGWGEGYGSDREGIYVKRGGCIILVQKNRENYYIWNGGKFPYFCYIDDCSHPFICLPLNIFCIILYNLLFIDMNTVKLYKNTFSLASYFDSIL